MSIKTVIWPAEPHTLAKHEILGGYLDAWFPILTNQAYSVGSRKEVLFIDGFAGPGEYAGGEKGSPIIALEKVFERSRSLRVPVRFLFIEDALERCNNLDRLLNPYYQRAKESPIVRLEPPTHGDCDTVLNELLDQHERRGSRFGPAFAFLDQFGYSAVSMDLVKRIMGYDQCEVLICWEYKDMNRWIGDSAKWGAFDRAFGNDDWRPAINMAEEQRRNHLLSTYRKNLNDIGRAKYVHYFSMFDNQGKLLYWLIFCTGHLSGLFEMKRSMWRVDERGLFRFSDKDIHGQMFLSDGFTQKWLADVLARRLANQTLTANEIREFVLVQTPCYRFKDSLRILEVGRQPRSLEVVSAPEGRKAGTYEELDEIVLRFRPYEPVQEQSRLWP